MLLVVALAVLGMPGKADAVIGTIDVVPASDLAGAVGDVTITFTTANVLAANGRIVITFPAPYFPTTTTVTSSTIDGGFTVNPVTTQVVTILRDNTGTAEPAGAQSITLNSVRNPLTPGNPGAWAIASIATQTSAGGANESNNVGFDPAGDTIASPGAIAGFNATLPPGTVVGDSTTVTLAFTTTVAVPADGRFVVTLPAGYAIGTPAVAGGSVTGGFSANVVGQTITITRSGSGAVLGAGAHTLAISGVRPVQTGDLGDFPLFRTENAAFGQLDSVTTASAAGDDAVVAGTISDIDFTPPGSGVANAGGTLLVTFTPTNAWPVNGRVRITLPTGGGFTGTPVVTSPGGSVDGTFSAAAPGASNEVTITRTGTNTAATGALTLQLTLVRNPPYATTSSAWGVTTMTSASAVIDAGTTSETLTISSFVAGPTLTLPSAAGVNRTGNAVIGFTPTGVGSGIVSNATIKVTFPDGVTVATPLGAPFGTTGGITLDVTAVTGQTVTLARTDGGLTVTAAVTITLAGITNPSSAGVTSTWGVVIEQAGVLMSGNPAAAGVTIVAGAPTGTDIQPLSLVVGVTGTVNVSTTLINPIPALGRIEITFPAGFTLPPTPRVTIGAPEVTLTGYTIPGGATVSVSGQTVIVTRTSGGSYTAPGGVLFGLQNITNPSVTGAAGTYTLTTRLAGGGIIDTATGASDTITAGVLTSVDVQPDSLALGARTDVTVTFTTANPLPSDGRIRVVMPTGFGFDEIGATSVISSSTIDGSFAKSVSGATINAIRSGGTAIPTGTTVSLRITNVRLATTPTVTTSSTGTYTVSTMTAAALTIDSGVAAADTYTGGALTGVSITPQSFATGSTGTVALTFTTTNQLPAAGQLRVELPTGTVTTAVAVSSHNLAGGLTVAPATVGTTDLTITRFGGATAQSGTFTVTLSGITMPTGAGTTESIVLSTHNITPGFSVVDTATVAGWSLTAAVLGAADVTPSSTAAGAITNLTVSLTTTISIPADGAFRVTLPAGFSFPGSPGLGIDDVIGVTGGLVVTRQANTQILTIARDGTGTAFSGAMSFAITGVRAPTTVGAAGTYALAVLSGSAVTQEPAAPLAGDSFTGLSLSGGGGTTITEAEVVAGGATIVLTLFGDTFVAGVDSTPAIRDAVVAGFDGGAAWDAAVLPALTAAADGVPGVTRTSATVLTVVLPAVPGFDLAADDTVTVTMPASALTGAAARVATTTIAVTSVGTVTPTPTTTAPGGGGGGGGGGVPGVVTTTTTATTTTTTPTTPTTTPPGDEPVGPEPIAEPARQTSSGTGAFEVIGDEIVPIVPPVPTASSVVGGAGTASGLGGWVVTADGGVFTRGDAAFFGSAGALPLVQPIVGMAMTPSGNGYWLVAADGGIFAFGDARFYGSTGGIVLNQPIVGMVATPSGNGYWLIATDGGVFTFGDAQFFGSTGAIALNQPIVGMAITPTGAGYWLAAADGGIFTFGDARFYGSTGLTGLPSPAVGIVASSDGRGYVIVDSGGRAHRFGSAVVVPTAS